MPESLVHWINESADQMLKQIEFPKATDELWRKFPLSQLDLDALSNIQYATNVTEMTYQDEKSDEKYTTAKHFLENILKKANDNFFALYTLRHAKQIYFYELNEIKSDQEYYDFQCTLSANLNGNVVLLISIPPNVSVKIRETYFSKANTDQLHMFCSLNYYHLGAGSKLEVLMEEEYDENLFHFRSLFSFQERDSSLNYFSFPKGGYRGKQFYRPELNGIGSAYQLIGVSSLVKRELLDIDAKVTHLADHTSSRISYKTIVNDRSHHIFTGNLAIPSHAKKVTAHQESHNLSLNKKARAEANPKLEVMAEDVSCTHGATVGDIDEEQLFYLLSRGLTQSDAKSLLVAAFYEEVVSKIPFSEAVKSHISENIRKSVLGN